LNLSQKLPLLKNRIINGFPNYSVNLKKKSRPRKRATLSQHISAMFQKNIAQSDVDRIIDILFANKMISETNNTITYEF